MLLAKCRLLHANAAGTVAQHARNARTRSPPSLQDRSTAEAVDYRKNWVIGRASS